MGAGNVFGAGSGALGPDPETPHHTVGRAGFCSGSTAGEGSLCIWRKHMSHQVRLGCIGVGKGVLHAAGAWHWLVSVAP